MCMRDGHRKHSSHATMFSLATALHHDLLKFNDIENECDEQ